MDLHPVEQKILTVLLKLQEKGGPSSGWRLAEQLHLAVDQHIDMTRRYSEMLVEKGLAEAVADEQGARWYYARADEARRALGLAATALPGPLSRPSSLAERSVAPHAG